MNDSKAVEAGDAPLTASDGTEWVFSPGLNLWTGWMPGEDGTWTMSPEEFAAAYSDVQPVTGKRGSEWAGGKDD